MGVLIPAGSISAVTAGTAKVALSPCLASAASTRASPSLAPNTAGALRMSRAAIPSGPLATLRSTTMWTAQRLPCGQRTSASARLFSLEMV